MTIEEKLENFYQVSVDHAREASVEEMDSYRESLEKIFEEHKTRVDRQAALHLKTEQEEIRRISNMEISREMLQVKRTIREKVAELEGKLFAEVDSLVLEYKKSPEYLEWMKAQIREELAYDPSAEIHIYIDPSDEVYLEELKKIIDRENATILVSSESFIGGTRGVIRERNVLIDNSFAKKIGDVRERFELREEL